MNNKKGNRVRKTVKKQVEKQKKNQLFANKRVKALITTFLTAIGIYVAFLTPVFRMGSAVVDDFFISQATVGGLYINSLAVISTVYSKFSSSILIYGRTFGISLFSIFIAINIFCQSECMYHIEYSLLLESLRKMEFAYLLQIIFFISIYILILEPVIEFKKERIRK